MFRRNEELLKEKEQLAESFSSQVEDLQEEVRASKSDWKRSTRNHQLKRELSTLAQCQKNAGKRVKKDQVERTSSSAESQTQHEVFVICYFVSY